MTMHKALLLRDDINHMSQEKKEEEVSTQFMIALFH